MRRQCLPTGKDKSERKHLRVARISYQPSLEDGGQRSLRHASENFRQESNFISERKRKDLCTLTSLILSFYGEINAI